LIILIHYHFWSILINFESYLVDFDPYLVDFWLFLSEKGNGKGVSLLDNKIMNGGMCDKKKWQVAVASGSKIIQTATRTL
jgi:hypothetical protein